MLRVVAERNLATKHSTLAHMVSIWKWHSCTLSKPDCSNPITSVHTSGFSSTQKQFYLAQLHCVGQRDKDQRQRHATWSLPEIDTAVHFESLTASNPITSSHASCVSSTQVFSCQYGQVSNRTVCVWGSPCVISPGATHSSNSPLLFPRQQFCPMISRTNAPSKNTMQPSGWLTPFYPNRRCTCQFHIISKIRKTSQCCISQSSSSLLICFCQFNLSWHIAVTRNSPSTSCVPRHVQHIARHSVEIWSEAQKAWQQKQSLAPNSPSHCRNKKLGNSCSSTFFQWWITIKAGRPCWSKPCNKKACVSKQGMCGKHLRNMHCHYTDGQRHVVSLQTQQQNCESATELRIGKGLCRKPQMLSRNNVMCFKTWGSNAPSTWHLKYSLTQMLVKHWQCMNAPLPMTWTPSSTRILSKESHCAKA